MSERAVFVTEARADLARYNFTVRRSHVCRTSVRPYYVQGALQGYTVSYAADPSAPPGCITERDVRNLDL